MIVSVSENHIKVLMCDTLDTQFRDEIHKACKKKNIRVIDVAQHA